MSQGGYLDERAKTISRLDACYQSGYPINKVVKSLPPSHLLRDGHNRMEPYPLESATKYSLALLGIFSLIVVGCGDLPTEPEISNGPILTTPVAQKTVAQNEPPATEAPRQPVVAEPPGSEENDSRPEVAKEPPSGPENQPVDGITPGSEPDGTVSTQSESDPSLEAATNQIFSPLPPVKGLIALNREQKVWIDKDKKRIVVDGEICLTKGPLELLVSPVGGKTHEAVIKTDAKPSTVHAGLLAVGGQQGTPVTYGPEYRPATGSVVEILVVWWDEEGVRHEAQGQEFVRQIDRAALLGFENDRHLIELANKSKEDVLVLDGEPRARWIPVPPAIAPFVRKNGNMVMRPSRAGKQIEQLVILTDPKALDPTRDPPKKFYRFQFSPALRSKSEHADLIERAKKLSQQQSDVVIDGRMRARWEPVLPDRAVEISANRDFLTRPSPEGKQIEQLLIVGGPLTHEWVFGGSHIGQEPNTGEEFYLADRTGDFVCVSNFPTATLDLPVQSSSENSSLGFEAFTDNIPPKGTKVRLIITPQPIETDVIESKKNRAAAKKPVHTGPVEDSAK